MGDVRVSPRGGIGEPAVVRVPASKSIANRALVCACLAEGESLITNVPEADDSSLLLRALDSLGAKVGTPSERDVPGRVPRAPGTWSIAGPILRNGPPITVDAGFGGTTSRFLTAVGCLRDGKTVITGRDKLAHRPLDPLAQALRSLGASVETPARGGLPAVVSRGAIHGGCVTIDAGVSSQFVSALMLIGPCLEDGLTIELTGERVSRGYIEMSAGVMRRFGADVDVEVEPGVIRVEPGGYRPCDMQIESDYSAAAFPILASAMSRRNLTIPDLPPESLQGDARIIAIARQFGADVLSDGPSTHFTYGEVTSFDGGTFDMRHESDLVPGLAVALLAASSPSLIEGVGFIRHKESNRLEDLAGELQKLGAMVSATDDGLAISPRGSLRGGRVSTHDDHRLAMALSLAALLDVSIVIEDAACVSKSWPGYWVDMGDFLDVEWIPS